MKNAKDLAMQTLLNLLQAPLGSGPASQMKTFFSDLLDTLSNRCVQDIFHSLSQKYLSCFSTDGDYYLPSKVIDLFNTNIDTYLIDKDLQNCIFSKVVSAVSVPNNLIGNLMLCLLMKEFSKTLLAFVVRFVVIGADSQTIPLGEQFNNSNENINSVELKKNVIH